MAGNTFGKRFCMTTWGESHGRAVGVTVDGVPAGIRLCEEDIQAYLDRRRPGRSRLSTQRTEEDRVEILSGVFEGKTTGTPVSMLVFNQNQRSHDYSQIAQAYRPGHADYGYDMKYGFRDYRGGGRSSGRETIARVAAGAIAALALKQLGISVCAFALEIGTIHAAVSQDMPFEEIRIQAGQNLLNMPDQKAAEEAVRRADQARMELDSMGGVVECRILGMLPGIGEPVFDKLDARLAQAMMSIGAVKGVEIGDGFAAAEKLGSENNDSFYSDGQKVGKRTNHSGGILGGMSDGSQIVVRAAFKPTPSIAKEQQTVNRTFENINISIHGRHDPLIVPRAVVVVECMAAAVCFDLILEAMASRMDSIRLWWETEKSLET